jgi:hypothetical protein
MSFMHFAWRAIEEKHGLLNETTRIGTREGWKQRLNERGFRLKGHRLVHAGTAAAIVDEGQVEAGHADATVLSLVFKFVYRRREESKVFEAIGGDCTYDERHAWSDGEVRIEEKDDVLVIRLHSQKFPDCQAVDHAREVAATRLEGQFPGYVFLNPAEPD